MISRIGFSTQPTEFETAIRAGHMVAALCLLDFNLALWAKIDVVTVDPVLKLPIKLRFAITLIMKYAAAFEANLSLTDSAHTFFAFHIFTSTIPLTIGFWAPSY